MRLSKGFLPFPLLVLVVFAILAVINVVLASEPSSGQPDVLQSTVVSASTDDNGPSATQDPCSIKELYYLCNDYKKLPAQFIQQLQFPAAEEPIKSNCPATPSDLGPNEAFDSSSLFTPESMIRRAILPPDTSVFENDKKSKPCISPKSIISCSADKSSCTTTIQVASTTAKSISHEALTVTVKHSNPCDDNPCDSDIFYCNPDRFFSVGYECKCKDETMYKLDNNLGCASYGKITAKNISCFQQLTGPTAGDKDLELYGPNFRRHQLEDTDKKLLSLSSRPTTANVTYEVGFKRVPVVSIIHNRFMGPCDVPVEITNYLSVYQNGKMTSISSPLLARTTFVAKSPESVCHTSSPLAYLATRPVDDDDSVCWHSGIECQYMTITFKPNNMPTTIKQAFKCTCPDGYIGDGNNECFKPYLTNTYIKRGNGDLFRAVGGLVGHLQALIKVDSFSRAASAQNIVVSVVMKNEPAKDACGAYLAINKTMINLQVTISVDGKTSYTVDLTTPVEVEISNNACLLNSVEYKCACPSSMKCLTDAVTNVKCECKDPTAIRHDSAETGPSCHVVSSHWVIGKEVIISEGQVFSAKKFISDPTHMSDYIVADAVPEHFLVDFDGISLTGDQLSLDGDFQLTSCGGRDKFNLMYETIMKVSDKEGKILKSEPKKHVQSVKCVKVSKCGRLLANGTHPCGSNGVCRDDTSEAGYHCSCCSSNKPRFSYNENGCYPIDGAGNVSNSLTSQVTTSQTCPNFQSIVSTDMSTFSSRFKRPVFALFDLMGKWLSELIRHDFGNMLSLTTSAIKLTNKDDNHSNDAALASYVEAHAGRCLKFFQSTIVCSPVTDAASNGHCRDDGQQAASSRSCLVDSKVLTPTLIVNATSMNDDVKQFEIRVLDEHGAELMSETVSVNIIKLRKMFYIVIYCIVLFVSIQHLMFARAMSRLLSVSIDGDMGDTSEVQSRLRSMLLISSCYHPARVFVLKLVRRCSDQGGAIRGLALCGTVVLIVASGVKFVIATRGLMHVNPLLMVGALTISLAYASASRKGFKN